MNKRILFAGLVSLSILGVQGAALADHDDWHHRYDHDHDGKWDYNDFEKAQRDWERDHHRKELSEIELRNAYARYDRDHDGFWAPNEARKFHPW